MCIAGWNGMGISCLFHPGGPSSELLAARISRMQAMPRREHRRHDCNWASVVGDCKMNRVAVVGVRDIQFVAIVKHGFSRKESILKLFPIFAHVLQLQRPRVPLTLRWQPSRPTSDACKGP